MLPQENKPVCTVMTAHVAHFTAYYLSCNMLTGDDKKQHVPCEPACWEKNRFCLLLLCLAVSPLSLASLDIRHRTSLSLDLIIWPSLHEESPPLSFVFRQYWAGNGSGERITRGNAALKTWKRDIAQDLF